MIPDLIFYIGGTILNLFAFLFGIVQFVLPAEIENAIIYVFDKLNYFRGFVPITDLLNALSILITFFTFWYLIKIFLWLFSLLPWIGKTTEPPDLKAIRLHNRFKSVLKGKNKF